MGDKKLYRKKRTIVIKKKKIGTYGIRLDIKIRLEILDEKHFKD